MKTPPYVPDFDDTTCDNCNASVSVWPTGLVAVSRDFPDMFGGTLTACPLCAVGAHIDGHTGAGGGTSTLSMIRSGDIAGSDIAWYWHERNR